MVDILSDDHLEQFYREHVAGKTSLDEDIRAIEEEIDKVKRYQSTLRGMPTRYEVTLNSCGNSDASDDNLSGDEVLVSGRTALCFIT